MNTATVTSRINKPTLQDLGAPSASFFKCLHRPVLFPMVEPSHQQAQSVYPVLCSAFDDSSPRSLAPVYRAFPALLFFLICTLSTVICNTKADRE
jgi:M-phase inducer tyrosine phosphatase